MAVSGQPPLAAQGLVRWFADDPAVDGLDLEVGAGEIHAVIGLNGAGKTTLMRLLLGMVRPDAGRACILGHDAIDMPPQGWRHVGHLIETPCAYPELTVRENITAAGLLHGLDRTTLAGAVDDAIAQFELARWTHRRARHLSLGNRQRLGLASALMHAPSVLVLDEPANALDPAGVVFIRDLLVACKQRGAAILTSSHHLDEVARVADRITVLHRGQRVGMLDPTGADLERRFFDLIYEADLLREGTG